MENNQFTLHRRLWRGYRGLPLLVQVWMILLAVGVLIVLREQLSGPSKTERVSNAVAAAVRQATGPDPASSCSALSASGLNTVVREFDGPSTAGTDPLTACRSLAVRLRAQATAHEVTDLAAGSVRQVQFRADGSALVLYVAADHRLGARLTMSASAGRWLIDSVEAGEFAASSSAG